MKNSYLKVFVDWGERYQKLSDAEFGRLMRAAIAYKGGNPVPELTGREELMWDGIKLDIDRDNEQYSAICEARSEAGRRGAETRWNGKSNLPDSKNSKSHLPYGKNSQDKEKDKEEDKDKDNHNHNMTMMTPPNELAAESNDLATVYQAWDKASGRIVSLAEQEELIALLDEYGREPMLAAIRQCTLHNAVSLSYLGAVLRGPKEKPNTKPEIDAKWL